MPILTAAPESGNLISCEEMCHTYYASVRRRVHFLVYHSPVLYNREALVEDLVQETFYKAVRGYTSLTHGNHVYAWLYRIATNVVIDYLRHRHEEVALEDISQFPAVLADPYDTFLQDEITGPLFYAWGKTSPTHRRVLALLAEGYKPREAAEVLGYSKDEMYGTLREARASFIRRYRVYQEVAA